MGSDSKAFTFTRRAKHNYFLFVSKIANITGCTPTTEVIQELGRAAGGESSSRRTSISLQPQQWETYAVSELRD